ncbi:MAG TPA: energy transducer TonB, partial [Polyangiaceae bacterium]|nr:energy transducer TonB [Polyangiaceae bacterium]
MGMQPNNSTRPGQMTAVMRAMSVQTGPKVLRLGLVQGGRVLEERIIKQRTSVTVGANEKAMFVLQAQNLPANFKLFELIGADYYLNFIDGMNGRLALTSGITDLAALRGQAKKVGNAYQVRLTEDARGKVVIGDTTFLFQFVEPPPVQPRPQLPLSVRGGVANEIDWTLTIIAAFSFLVHFGFVGAMYSDWMDPPVSEGISVSALIDQLKNIPTPPPLEVPTDTTVSPTATAANTAAPASKPAGGGQHASTGGAGKSSSVSDAKAAALTQQAEAMQMQLLAALGGASSVSGALGRNGEIPPVDLSAAAASGAGVSGTGGDLRTGSGGGPVQGGGGRGGLGGIGG